MRLKHGLPAALVLALCLGGPASTLAQSSGGSTLAQTPNAFGCETKPTFTDQSFDGFYRLLPSGQPDCTWFQAGMFGNISDPLTGAVPGDGRITNIAVRGGQNPATIRFVILRLFADSASGSRQCCFFVTETPPVRPTPGTGVSNFPVNLPVERNTNPQNGLVTQDYVGVSAVSGTGLLPVFGNGRHNTLGDYVAGNPVAGFLYPRFGSLPSDSPNAGGRREEAMPGVEVLLRWTWCPAGAPAQACGGTNGGGGGGGGGDPAAALSIRNTVLRAANGRVPLQIQCLLSTECVGRALLRTRGNAASASKRSRVIGSRKVRIGAGKTKKVRVKLNALGRRLAKRKKVRLTAEVKLGAAGTTKKNVTLKRPR